MQVKLSQWPDYAKTGTVDFTQLNGGLNLRELEWELPVNESPNMGNLWWRDGVLQSRDGQAYLSDGTGLGTGYACEYVPLWGLAFFHIGTGLYWARPGAAEFTLTVLCSGVPQHRGTFFRYDERLFYKNRGGFFRISRDDDGTLSADRMEDVAQEAENIPVIVVNADPATGSGSIYQPENRLSPRKEVWYNAKSGVTAYQLPVTEISGVVSVHVDGVKKTEGTDYTVSKSGGTVTFKTAPPVTNPATNNSVKIVFEKANQDAFNSIMDCSYAAVSGDGDGGTDVGLCVLLAGCDAQPNAVFWNGNDSYGMNAAYFPMTNYNICGNTVDAVSGFGKQYNDLILFKEYSVGKLDFSVQTVDGRDSPAFSYQTINDRIGCNLPWSIRLIENNLVFCNTERGVHMVLSSSAAYENNIVCISGKVNGNGSTGLLADVRTAELVQAADDSRNYWLRCADGRCYLWCYEASTFENPSWFRFTGIDAADFFRDAAGGLYHLDTAGRVTKFGRSFSDYGQAIDKRYTFPTQYFGGYDRLKDVTGLLVTLRRDTDTEVEVVYETDYESRKDLTNLTVHAPFSFVPRNLSFRNLSVSRFGAVFKRRPGCRHIRYFSFTLKNAAAGAGLGIVSAQVQYRLQGKER